MFDLGIEEVAVVVVRIGVGEGAVNELKNLDGAGKFAGTDVSSGMIVGVRV